MVGLSAYKEMYMPIKKSIGGGPALSDEEIGTLQHYIEILEGNQVRITKNLDRDLYERVKQIFEHLGGVYMPGRKRFEWSLDPSPLIAQTIADRLMPKENPLDFYASPPDVIEALFASLEWGGDLRYHSENQPIRVLEPSAGLGHLADAFRVRYPMATIDVCELDPYRRAVLQSKGYQVRASDFLQYHPSYSYDVVLMNPPFTVNGNPFTWISHITHAEKMLSDSSWSKLVSVVPSQFSRMERYQTFHIHVLEVGDYEELPQGSFLESGTNWETSIVSLSRRKNHFYANWDAADLEDGYPNRRLKEAWMYISVDEQLYGKISALLRDMVEGKLVVYSNGTLAPETIARIHAFCETVTHRLLSSYKLYVPFTQQDESFMQRHILNEYSQARGQYSEMKRMEWEREQQRQHTELKEKVQKAATRVQRLRERLAACETELAQSTRALEEFEQQRNQPPAFTPAPEPPAPGTVPQKPSGYNQLSFF
jgi:hypothetical protein